MSPKKENFISRVSNFRNLYIFGLVLIAIGLPLSKFLMSVGQFVLLGHWLLQFNYREKLKRFVANKWALLLSSLFLLHLIGLAFTSDYNYAFNDIRIKLPLLLLPFFVASQKKLKTGEFRAVKYCFLAAVLAGTFVSIYEMSKGGGPDFHDPRELSVFISHIRFSLMICLAVFIALFSLKNETLPVKALLVLVLIWMIVFLFLTAFFTGLVVFTLTACVLLFFLLVRQKSLLTRAVAFLIFASLLVLPSIIIIKNVNEYFSHHPVETGNLEQYSEGGEYYFHDTTGFESRITENGYYVWRYIAEKELKREWNERSALDFEGKDEKGQTVKGTLVRYMTSKGLRKDSAGMSEMTDRDIKAVEKGVANEKYLRLNPIDERIQKIIWEFDNYRKGDEPNGHSLIMRWIYWKTGWQIFTENFWLGTGTGDIDKAFDMQYEENESRLEDKWRLRAHNQFLTFAVTFGILGFLWFVVVLFYPFLKLRKWRDWYYLAFLIIAVLSMMAEDTLETQAGVTFFAFWNTLLLLGRKT